MGNLFRRGMRILSAFASTLLFSAVLLARSGVGSLYGKVTDPLGTAVSGVVVAAITRQGRVRIGVTDNEGSFAISELAPGKYTIWAGGEGFSLYENSSFVVKTGQTQMLDIWLHPNSERSRVSLMETAEVWVCRVGHRANVAQEQDLLRSNISRASLGAGRHRMSSVNALYQARHS